MTQEQRRVLGDRYEIDGVLGQGGMAKVFKGTDRVLGRTVAVKVLSPQFADDNQFVVRFRREAQAAAGLNHPNVVSIFDTGSHQDVHYIVMEYVEGKTLRDVLRAEAPLMPERATEITAAIAKGLASAHDTGLVHRDIKPGNVMITDEGEVKVMDFGIARTTTGDTLTQTAAVLGTASYLSPEQAQGEPVDPRSDIYAVGCVLYEMLTGRPPFTGDSPVAIAYKHVRDAPVPPRTLNPDIPEQLEAVVMKAMAKNPANRYQSAAELRDDLQRVLQGLPTMAEPLLAGQTTEMMSREHTSVLTGVEEEAPPEERRRNPWLVALLVLLILAALAAAAFFLIRALTAAEPVTVPNVVGMDREEAEQRLRQEGLVPNVVDRVSRNVPEGEVFRQDPEPGEQVDEGSEVEIVVSRGPGRSEVPDVVGESQEDAEAILDEEGFEVSVATTASDAAAGIVVAQDPEAGTRLRRGSTVTITVSTGPATVEVPDVRCQDEDSARQEIEGAGLSFERTGERFSTDCDEEEGVVIEQNPSPGTRVEEGTTVGVTISRGPEPTPTMPTPTSTPTPTLTETPKD